ncbi:DUF1059 domain-containing protein [bacterium]|nr:DUF1059 domain-containing protein [bacterium]
MKKAFCCEDLGIKCDWVGKAETVEELLSIVKKHASEVHKMRDMNDAIKAQIIGKMRDVE